MTNGMSVCTAYLCGPTPFFDRLLSRNNKGTWKVSLERAEHLNTQWSGGLGGGRGRGRGYVQRVGGCRREDR